MRTFTFFMVDERYGVPTMDMISAPDEVRAAVLAQRRLAESDYHLEIEVRENDAPVARVSPGGVIWLGAS
ncbi:MAG TPA: hypothetical protein VFE13_06710 [Caulobacteraceae bacterium]|nr:hypothetical protein [Caulobacteraceae bacterium]